MQSIGVEVLRASPDSWNEIKTTLEKGGLVCFPAPSGYKLAVDLMSPAAVGKLLTAKRRVQNHPSLVFVPDEQWLPRVAAAVSDAARTLTRRFWPGALTLLVEANEGLDPKVRKPLTKAKGWLGVRQPEDDISLRVVQTFNAPLLVSSANLASKRGAASVAQVRKNFGRTVDLLIDGGDVNGEARSTLVDVSGDEVHVVRAGTIDEAAIRSALAG